MKDEIPCSRWAIQPSTAPRSCSRRATRFCVRDGVPDAFCQTCWSAWFDLPLKEVSRAEVSRAEYLRLTAVSEIMES